MCFVKILYLFSSAFPEAAILRCSEKLSKIFEKQPANLLQNFTNKWFSTHVFFYTIFLNFWNPGRAVFKEHPSVAAPVN